MIHLGCLQLPGKEVWIFSRRPGFSAFTVFILAWVLAGCSGTVRQEAEGSKTAEIQIIVDTPKSDTVFVEEAQIPPLLPYDTASKKILLVGDSQAGGIMYPLNDYCLENGHEIKAALIWFSASDRTLASNDTLPRMIATYQPDYILIVIGLNQVFQTQHEASRKAVQKIVSVFGSIPYAWIGPASWDKEGGISDMYAATLDSGTFFRSSDLPLERASDGRHPNMKGYRQWMDSIANWLSGTSRWRIKMDKPQKNNQAVKFPLKVLNAAKSVSRNMDISSKSKSDSIRADAVSVTRRPGHSR